MELVASSRSTISVFGIPFCMGWNAGDLRPFPSRICQYSANKSALAPSSFRDDGDMDLLCHQEGERLGF